MAVKSRAPCVWEMTETDVMVSQEDTHLLKRRVHIAVPGLEDGCCRWSAAMGRCVWLENGMTYAQ